MVQDHGGNKTPQEPTVGMKASMEKLKSMRWYTVNQTDFVYVNWRRGKNATFTFCLTVSQRDRRVFWSTFEEPF